MQKPTSIDNYIEQFPKDIQEKLEEMRNIIHKAAPKAEETISYSMPAFKMNKVIVYFAAFKNHIGFYPFPSGVAKFKKEASAYATTKGAIQFPFDKPFPVDLINKIVKFRVEEDQMSK